MSKFFTVTLISLTFMTIVFGPPSDDEDEARYCDYEHRKPDEDMRLLDCYGYMKRFCEKEENSTVSDCTKGAVLNYIETHEDIPYSIKRYFSYFIFRRITFTGLETTGVFCVNEASSKIHSKYQRQPNVEEKILTDEIETMKGECLNSLSEFNVDGLNKYTELPKVIHFAINKRNLEYYNGNPFAQAYMEHIANSLKFSEMSSFDKDLMMANPHYYCFSFWNYD